MGAHLSKELYNAEEEFSWNWVSQGEKHRKRPKPPLLHVFLALCLAFLLLLGFSPL